MVIRRENLTLPTGSAAIIGHEGYQRLMQQVHCLL